MLWIILSVVAALVVAFIVFVALRPAEFRITRKGVISAPPPVVFAHVNDFHAWEAWSPWAKIDPECKVRYEGPTAGPGAVFGWSGNNKVGEGRMTIVENRPSEMIRIRLEFLRPFKATNTAEFTFAPASGGTEVTWSMFGCNSFMAKAFSMFCDMDKMVGKDFEKGLAQMKAAVETSPG